MKLKVLHVFKTYFPDPVGGIQEVIKQISLSTQAHNIDSKIYVLSPKPEPNNIFYEEGEVIREKSWLCPASCDLGGLSSLKKFQELVEWCDVVHYQFPWPFADVLHLMSNVKKASVMSYQSDIVRQKFLGKLYNPLLRKMLASMDAVVASSPTYAKTSKILNQYVSSEKLKVIPNGIIDYKSRNISKDFEEAILKKFDIKNSPYVLSIGALRYYKGLHTLVEASSRINAKVIIAGSGPQEKHLKKLALKHKITNINFTGYITEEEKIVLLRNCNVYALPSHVRSEAFGMVLVEASMFGKPMVCCEINSGPSYININKETGLTVSPENPEEFSKAVNTLLNEDIAYEYGRAARKRYEKNFSGEALGLAYAKLYKKLVNKNI